MKTREKLIDILERAESAVYWNSDDRGFIEKITDHLIENGVTVQEWIPVSERLPDDEKQVLAYIGYEKTMIGFESFSKTFAEYGMVAPLLRMEDKLSRLKSLYKKGVQQVKQESVRDTLIDLANYAIMTVMELDSQEESRWE